MIRTLRNSGFGQLFLGSMVVAIILAFIFTGAPSGSTESTDECAVEIGKTCIAPKDFNASFRLLTSIGLNDSAVKSLKLREQVAVGLAERQLLNEEARRLGIGTSEKDIDDELFEGRTRVSLPADGAERLATSLAMCVATPGGCAPGTIGLRAISVKQGGTFDFELYTRTVRVVSGRSPVQFKEMQQLEYTAERVRQLIRSQVRVSENEAFLAYSRARSKVTARTVDIQSSWFAHYVSMPTEEEVSEWIKGNKAALDAAVKERADSWKDGCAVVSEIRFDSADPTSAEAKAQKEEAEAVRKQAVALADFGTLARKESSSESAPLGGQIGCLDDSYGAGATTLIEAAAELKSKNDVSPVIETIQGFHVLKLLGRVDAKNKDALLRSFLGYKLASEALAKKAAEEFGKSLIAKAKSGQSLAEAMEGMLQELIKGGPFEGEESPALTSAAAPKSDISRAVTIEQEPIANVSDGESPAEILFALEKEDDVAEKLIVTRTGFAVMQLKSKELITREKFKEERSDVMARLQKRKAEQALSEHLMTLVKKAGGVKMNPKYVPPEGADDKDETEATEEKDI
jgi:parvulin-like peptidyl-prolyl isomerase